jgi:nitrate/nitrite-specific signal transduction histidine kinase
LPFFRLEIEDNGIGFDQKIKNPKSNTIGLRNCFDRAKIIDFDFKIESFSNKGTKVILKEQDKLHKF